MGEGADGGRGWDPSWRQGSGAYSEPSNPPPPPRARSSRSEQGPWGDPTGWDATSLPIPQHRPELPPAMRTATTLMWVGAGLTILSTIVFFATTDQYAEGLAEASGVRSQARIDRAVAEAQVREVFQTVLGVALWIWMAVKNADGRKWARVVATVFGVINVAGFVLGGALLAGFDSQDMIDYLLPQMVLGTVSVVLGIVILVQLYRPASSHFYDETTRYEAAMTLRGYR